MRRTTIGSMLMLGSLAIPAPAQAQAPADELAAPPPVTEGVEAAPPVAPPAPEPPPPAPAPEVAATADVAPQETERWTDNAGHFGVGGEALLGGAVGLRARMQLSDRLDLGLTFGTLFASASAGEADFDQTAILVGLGAGFRILTAESTAIGIIGDANILTSSTSGPEIDGFDADSSSLTFGLGVGLQAELFLASFLSLHGQTGVRLAITSGESGGEDTSGFALSLAGDLLTGFGFTFWL